MATTTQYLDPMTGHGPFTATQQSRRPNILFISTDMVPPEFYMPGAAPVKAPHLQALRDRHLFFANAYCTSPLCSPSRAAYLTGRHSYITTNSERAHDGHAIHLRPDDILFAEYLKPLDYHLRHVGKCHAGAHKFSQVFSENDSPWDRWSPPWNDDDDYIGFLAQRGLQRFTFDRSIVGQSLTGEGTGNHYGGWIAPQNGQPFPSDATYPAYLVDKAIATLEARPDPDQPFYLQVDFFGPHQPFAIPDGFAQREAALRQELELPASYGNVDSADRPEPRIYQLYRQSWGLTDPQTVLDYRVANLLQFELIDQMIGRLLDYLRQRDLYDDTWIFFIADHGEMNGEQALIDKGAFLNPRVIQAPIIIKPGTASPHTGPAVVSQAVSLLDLAPTVLDIAGISTPTRLDGVSLLDSLAGQARPDEHPILFEVWSHVMPNPSVGTVFTAANDRDYMFTFNACDPVDELYLLDGSTCPTNLWPDPQQQPLVDQAVATLHHRLAGDERWKSYRGFVELTYPDRLAAAGDRQLFF